jgi:dipeptidyl aminopeptidase/acylaminoacyl peptidase
LEASYSGKITADLGKVGIWGHSNGGHVALSVLAISGVTYPTVLWAPVSVSFPYSILYYTDESDDQGKALRKTLAGFEENYNTELFSPPGYYNWIKASVEINQGLADQEVPYWWSDNLVATLKKDKVTVKYLTYPGADHNMLPSGWSEAAMNTLNFYNNQFLGK